MELCDKSIEDIIGKEEISPKEKIRIIKETAEGLKVLHSKGIIHRDLKWGNVLRGFDKIVKLTDFDTAKEEELSWRFESMTQSSNIGTPGFRPPEVIIKNKYSLEGDVYAFGLMIYCLLFENRFPYFTQFQCSCGVLMEEMKLEMLRSKNWSKIEEHVAECNLRPLISPEKAKKMPKFLIDMMIQCWDRSSFNRPSFEEIMFRFDLEDRRQFSKIYLKFRSHPDIPDQKMYLTKPYQRKKIVEWIETKFRKLQASQSASNNDDDSSSINYLDFVENEDKAEEETEGEGQEETKIEVLYLEHSVQGSIHSDHDVKKVVDNELNPTFQVGLKVIPDNESFLSNLINVGHSVLGRKISVEEYSEMEKENVILKEEKKKLEDHITGLKKENVKLKSLEEINKLLKMEIGKLKEKNKELESLLSEDVDF